MLEFSDLSVNFADKQILRGVSFAIKPGDYVSILGPNGAGKSTLLKCALGIVNEWEGRIFLKGESVRDYTQRELARIVAYVPQNGFGAFPQTVYDFVLMGRFARLGLLQSVRKLDELAVQHALELTQTENFAQRLMSSLSGGERQRVVIAAALAQEPEILLLDEVCHFLDPQHESEVQTLLDKINREKRVTILSVTHDINRAAFHSTKIVALKDGQVVYDGDSRGFMQAETLNMLYGKRFVFTRHPEKDLQIVVPGE